MKLFTSVAVVALLTIAASGMAYADGCSGRDHTTGTVLGAVGGAAIGGVATHNVGGAVVGGVVGGLAGNAIARSEDCDRQTGDRQGYRDSDRQGYDGRGGDRTGYAGVYLQDTSGRDNESDYWGVDSYSDFGADYQHISVSIQRGRERGFYNSYQAHSYFQQLQQIRSRADWQQRNGRFDPQDIEMRLTGLRQSMHAARDYQQVRDGQDYRR